MCVSGVSGVSASASRECPFVRRAAYYFFCTKYIYIFQLWTTNSSYVAATFRGFEQFITGIWALFGPKYRLRYFLVFAFFLLLLFINIIILDLILCMSSDRLSHMWRSSDTWWDLCVAYVVHLGESKVSTKSQGLAIAANHPFCESNSIWTVKLRKYWK